MNHPVPLILNTIIVWSQICGFIPYIHYGFWGVLNVRGMGLLYLVRSKPLYPHENLPFTHHVWTVKQLNYCSK